MLANARKDHSISLLFSLESFFVHLSWIQDSRNTSRYSDLSHRLCYLQNLCNYSPIGSYTSKGRKESHRFSTLVRLLKTGNESRYTLAEWIWSDLFVWQTVPRDFARKQCLLWYERQPNPRIYTGKSKPLKYSFFGAREGVRAWIFIT